MFYRWLLFLLCTFLASLSHASLAESSANFDDARINEDTSFNDKTMANAKVDSQAIAVETQADTINQTVSTKPDVAKQLDQAKQQSDQANVYLQTKQLQQTNYIEETNKRVEEDKDKQVANKETIVKETTNKKIVTEKTIKEKSTKEKTVREKGLFTRGYYYFFGDPDEIEIPKIEVSVIALNKAGKKAPSTIINEALSNNVTAALEVLTEEELIDFKIALPRLRLIAKDAAQAVGFYDAKFEFKKINQNRLQVAIKQNSPVLIQSSNIVLLTKDAGFQKLVEQSSLKKGLIFNHQHYESLKNAISLMAKSLGYFDAKWQASEVKVRLPNNTADINMRFKTGKRYQFGELILLDKLGQPYYSSHVKNQIEVNRKVIRRLQTFNVGDDFNQNKLTAFRNQLLATQYFNTVDISLGNHTSQKTGVIPIIVKLDSSKPNTAEAGFGYGTDTGFRIRGSVARNLLNNRGHKISATAEAAQKSQALEVSYTRPFLNPITDTLTYFVGLERELRNSGLGNVRILNLTAGAQRTIGIGKWQKSYSLKYFYDELSTKNIKEKDIVDLPAQFKTGTKQQNLLLLGYGLNRTYLKGGLYPYHGVREYYKAEFGLENFISDVTLLILRSGLSGVESFGKNKKHQVIGSIDLASIVTKDFRKVPYNQRFFAGGDRSIRGYTYKSLSPENDQGFLLGGQHLALSSLEYNRLITRTVRLATFVDFGNAFDKEFNSPIKVGTGIGLRWLSPVGLVRVDAAAGVSEKKPPIRLHFYIGPPL